MGDNRNRFLFLAALFSLTVNAAAQAHEPAEHDHRSHDAHVHGTWELFAALDDSTLSISVKGPLIDVVGFERTPATEDERRAILDLQERLAAPELMLSLNERANCTLSEPVQIILPDGFAQTGDSHDKTHADEPHHEHDHHDHGHDHDHDAGKSDEQHADHDVHANDLEVTYSFDCSAPSRLRAISVTGFDAFPAIENIDAVFLANAQQEAQRLRRGSRMLKLD